MLFPIEELKRIKELFEEISKILGKIPTPQEQNKRSRKFWVRRFYQITYFTTVNKIISVWWLGTYSKRNSQQHKHRQVKLYV